jgi:hypothetical protein
MNKSSIDLLYEEIMLNFDKIDLIINKLRQESYEKEFTITHNA